MAKGGLLQDRQDIIAGFPVRQIIIWQRSGGFNFNKGYFLPTYEVSISSPSLISNWLLMGWMSVDEARPLVDEGLDPFMGSGTTAIAAEELERSWVGIDISPKYCAINGQGTNQKLPATETASG